MTGPDAFDDVRREVAGGGASPILGSSRGKKRGLVIVIPDTEVKVPERGGGNGWRLSIRRAKGEKEEDLYLYFRAGD